MIRPMTSNVSTHFYSNSMRRIAEMAIPKRRQRTCRRALRQAVRGSSRLLKNTNFNLFNSLHSCQQSLPRQEDAPFVQRHHSEPPVKCASGGGVLPPFQAIGLLEDIGGAFEPREFHRCGARLLDLGGVEIGAGRAAEHEVILVDAVHESEGVEIGRAHV